MLQPESEAILNQLIIEPKLHKVLGLERNQHCHQNETVIEPILKPDSELKFELFTAVTKIELVLLLSS